jgi:hypothetical protein
VSDDVPSGATFPLNEIVAPPPAFDAVTVRLYAPATVGVPVIAPVTPLRDRPAGNDPAVTVNVGAGEPFDVSVADIGTPTINNPNAPDTLVGLKETVPAKEIVALPAEFVAVIVSE